MKKKIIAILTTSLILIATLIPITCSAEFIIVDDEGENNSWDNYGTTQGTVLWEIGGSYEGDSYIEYIPLTQSTLPILKDKDVENYLPQHTINKYDIYGELTPIGNKYISYKETREDTYNIDSEVIGINKEQRIDVIFQKTQSEINTIENMDNSRVDCRISIRNVYVWGENLKQIMENEKSASVDIEMEFGRTASIDLQGDNVIIGDDEVDRRYTNKNGDVITENVYQESFYTCVMKKLGTEELVEKNLKAEVIVRINQTQAKSWMVLKWYYPTVEENEIWKIEEAYMPLQMEDDIAYNKIRTRVTTEYTTIKNMEDVIYSMAEEEKLIMPDSIDLGGWLATAITGFMDAEIGMGITIGGILIMFIAFASVMWLLKLFAGG